MCVCCDKLLVIRDSCSLTLIEVRCLDNLHNCACQSREKKNYLKKLGLSCAKLSVSWPLGSGRLARLRSKVLLPSVCIILPQVNRWVAGLNLIL